MANTTIQVRKSGVTGNVPPSLNFGELALNYADGKLYYKNASGTITYISSGSGANSFATINANSSLILATSNTDTLSIAPGNNITVAANTVSKTIIVGLTNDVTVANSLIVGSGTGGTISGANSISSNTITANSVVGAIPLSVNITAGAGNQNVAVYVTGANTKGGTGYVDFLQANNRSGGANYTNKYFRLDSNGQFQIINSAYTQNIFNLNDSGVLTVPNFSGVTLVPGGGGVITFSDGTTQTTAAGGAAADSLARTVANAAYVAANNASNVAFSAYASANNIGNIANGAFTQANTAQTLAQAAFNKANTGGSTAFSTFIDPSGNTVSATANTSLKFVAGSGIQINVSNTNPTSLAISSLPGQQGLTVDWGFVSDPLYAYYDFGSSMVL